MRVIPVIDLMGGKVVRGVAGRRSEYRAIQSQIASDARPATVARAFVDQFGFDTAYVADLDAILNGPLSTLEWLQIESAGLNLLLDAGIGDVARARRVLYAANELQIDLKLVIGLESLESPDALTAIQRLCQGSATFSLDMLGGQPLTQIAAWKSLTPSQIAAEAISRDVNRLILLDLADVGVAGGSRTLQLCRELRSNHPRVELIAGGGVRGIDDLRALADAGCDAALVASALHDGRLTKHDVESLSALL
jgi:phosphoribosylformimino-5-aminoimidazole carboxamide ribotide isomerase